MASESAVRVRENERVARRVPEDIATDGNLDLVEDVYADDAVEHGPMGDIEGREAIGESLAAFLGAFDDFSATVEDVVAEGDTVAMRVTLRGTHTGEFMGLEPTDESFEIANAVFTRVENGRIAERWVIPDMASLYAQLGVEELPEPPAG